MCRSVGTEQVLVAILAALPSLLPGPGFRGSAHTAERHPEAPILWTQGIIPPSLSSLGHEESERL